MVSHWRGSTVYLWACVCFSEATVWTRCSSNDKLLRELNLCLFVSDWFECVHRSDPDLSKLPGVIFVQQCHHPRRFICSLMITSQVFFFFFLWIVSAFPCDVLMVSQKICWHPNHYLQFKKSVLHPLSNFYRHELLLGCGVNLKMISVMVFCLLRKGCAQFYCCDRLPLAVHLLTCISLQW